MLVDLFVCTVYNVHCTLWNDWHGKFSQTEITGQNCTKAYCVNKPYPVKYKRNDANIWWVLSWFDIRLQLPVEWDSYKYTEACTDTKPGNYSLIKTFNNKIYYYFLKIVLQSILRFHLLCGNSSMMHSWCLLNDLISI